MNQLEILSSPGGTADCSFSGAAVLVEMVYVHETLTLIILARYITWHLKRENYLVEVAAALRDWREQVENIAGAASATFNNRPSEAVSARFPHSPIH